MDTSILFQPRNISRETCCVVGRLSFIVVIFILADMTSSFAQDARYAVIKELARDEFANDKQINRLDVSNEGVNLAICTEFAAEGEPGAANMTKGDQLRFDLAIEVLQLEDGLERAGYDLRVSTA